MALFIRKNIVTFALKFTADDGSLQQPGAASVVLAYKDLSGSSHDETITLTYSSVTNLWTGTWDSSASGQGVVYWMAYGYGTLQAAAQGQFEVAANPANTV